MNELSEPIAADYTTLEGLKTHPLWEQLTEKQATFLEQFILTGNKVESALEAYDTTSRTSAVALAHTALKGYEVKTLLSLYRGYSIRGSHVTRTELLSLISDRLRSEKLSISEFRNLSAVYADVKGWRISKQKRGTNLLDKDPEDLKSSLQLMQLVQQYEHERGNTTTRRSKSDEEDEDPS
jgi:hypothetical protein